MPTGALFTATDAVTEDTVAHPGVVAVSVYIPFAVAVISNVPILMLPELYDGPVHA
jgi:hypothetical protein